ncbi:MAG: MBL fold metallo-hydrolase [Chitinophagales bacterium]|nr:MBL fold metallo-hydrolase [Chitinophagales bacterium]
MQIANFIFNPFSENTYLMYEEGGECWVVDPGYYGPEEGADLLKFIEGKKLRPTKVLLTHAHLDHVFGLNDFLTHFPTIPFYIHADEMPVLQAAPEVGERYGLYCAAVTKAPEFLKEGDTLHFGNEVFEVFFTPGHSPGSISFYNKNNHLLISGDVLFQGSIGRTDLPGGSFELLEQHIQNKLYPLPDETQVLSGHGPVTTIGEEKAHNPFVRPLNN